MNRHETYNLCHEIMLTAPGYTAHECNGVTYLLFQIADRDTDTAIQGFVINPAIPENGYGRDFVKFPDDAQVAIAGLSRAAEAIRDAHRELQRLKKLSQELPDDTLSTDDPAIKDIKQEVVGGIEAILRRLRSPDS